jgi:CBS domain-containing protein
LYALSGWLAGINLSLAFFNLIPGFPLDGGRIFRALVWSFTNNLRLATRIATSLGRLVAFGLILFGVGQIFAGAWANGLWIAFIGWFLENAATNSYRHLAVQEMLSGHTARDVMSTDCSAIPRALTIEELVDKVLLPTGRRCFPVLEGNQLYGLLTLHGIRGIPRQEWATTRAEQAMIPRNLLKSVGPDASLGEVFDRMTAEDTNQFLVVQDEQFLGMVARDSVLNYIRTRSELGV